MDDVRLNVLVPKDLHRRAKVAAALHGHSLSEIVRSALRTTSKRWKTRHCSTRSKRVLPKAKSGFTLTKRYGPISMPYRVEYSGEALRNLRQLPGHYRQRAKHLIEALSENPRPHQAKELRDNPNGYRLWLDKWRIIYRVNDELHIIFVAAVRRKKGPETYDNIPWDN